MEGLEILFNFWLGFLGRDGNWKCRCCVRGTWGLLQRFMLKFRRVLWFRRSRRRQDLRCHVLSLKEANQIDQTFIPTRSFSSASGTGLGSWSTIGPRRQNDRRGCLWGWHIGTFAFRRVRSISPNNWAGCDSVVIR